MKNIELEYRAILSEEQFINIKKTLKAKARFLGNDSKETVFYIWSDKLGKIVYNDLKKTAKLSMKLGRISSTDSFEEIEFSINYYDREAAKKLFEVFNPSDIQTVHQFRDNYQYKKINIAIKYTRSWGFHIELEKMISMDSEKFEAEKEIRRLADELGCKIMEPSDLKIYTEKIDNGHNYGIYSDNEYPYK